MISLDENPLKQDYSTLLRELKNSPNTHGFLDKKDELHLVLSAKKWDLIARDILIFSNMRRLSWMANSLISIYHLEMKKDMIQAWVIWIINSINNFNEDLGFQFWTHAKFAVKKEMLAVLENDAMIVVHRWEARERSSIKKYIKNYVGQNMRTPTISQIMETLNFSRETVLNCLDALMISDSAIITEPVDTLLGYNSTETIVLRRQVQRKVVSAFQKLSQPEQWVIWDIIQNDQMKWAWWYGPSQVSRLRISWFGKLRELLRWEWIRTANILDDIF